MPLEQPAVHVFRIYWLDLLPHTVDEADDTVVRSV